MSTAIIVNAAPMYIPLGAKDSSGRVEPRVPEARPTHLPKIYLYASGGPREPITCVGGERTRIFGDDTFDPLNKYYNHATVFADQINRVGNQQRIQRIIPEDAGPEPNLLVSLDIVATSIDDYERNADGSIKEDPITGDPIVIGKIPGVKAKYVISTRDTVVKMQQFGQATIVPGDMDNGDLVNPVQSQRIPLFELSHSFIGEKGKNSGFRIWAPNTNGTGLDKRILDRGLAYPYRLQVIRRPDGLSSPRPVESIYGSQYIDVSLKPGFVDPVTKNPMYIGSGKGFLDQYQNLNDPRYPKLYGDFGRIAVYEANIKLVTDMIYALESAYHTANGVLESDFTGMPGEEYKTNIISGTTSSGYKYHTVAWDTGTGAVSLGEYTNLYAQSGSDGTMNDTLFAAAVAAEVKEYNNPNSHLLNDALHNESIVYDSGFPMDTKYAMLSALGIRKDIFVGLCVYESGGPKMTAVQEHSAAAALLARARLFPESEFHGTEVCRALIMGRDALLRDSLWEKRVPVLAEVAYKAANYMGASSGIWANGKDFSAEDGAILEQLYDVNVSFTPAPARNRDWDVGLNWVQDNDSRSQFIPALKTVYGDDTSVLTSFTTVMGMIEVNKICQEAWRRFSGTDKYTKAQLAERVNEYISDRLRDRFDNRFVFIPETYYTTQDINRGFSWTTKVKMYAPNMHTVMTFFVETFRKDDLVTTN